MKKKSTLIGRGAFSNRFGAVSAKKLVAVLALLCFSFSSFAQIAKPEDKIDPVFRFLLFNEKSLKDTVVFKTFPERFKLKPTKGFLPGRTVPEERYDCIVYTENAQLLKDSGIIVRSVLPKFVTAWATLEQIVKMASFPSVKAIEAPQDDKAFNDVAVGGTGASLLHLGRLNNTPYKGKGVIVAIFDTGIDWDHPDFRDPIDQTKSRILRIWDQTLTPIAGEATPGGTLNYGVEYTQAQISNEIDGTPANFVREKDIEGHGSHVSGTATGNGSALASKKYTGMAPEADIVMIKGGDGSFSTVNQINALTYLQNLSTSLGKPVVLNMSIGGQSGAHDGTRTTEIAVDNFTASAPGRVVVISAGNDNGSAIHNKFTLAPSAASTMSFTVPAGTSGTDVFQYTCYANDNSAVTASASAPNSGGTVTAIAGQNLAGNVLSDSFTINLNNNIDAGSSDRSVNLYVTRNGSNTRSPAGTWTLTITNTSANTITVDGWLNYRNTVFTTTALVGGDNVSLVGSPGTATSAITAASFVGRLAWYSNGAAGGFNYTGVQQDNISTFSAIGPRRDGVLKPEIAASGQAVVSVLSSDATPAANSDVVEVGLYQKNQGTSMSAPVITGSVALLLQANPNATETQIKALLTANATKDVLTELPAATPNTTWGYGRVDVYKAMSAVFNCAPAARTTIQYENTYNSTQDGNAALTTQRVAVRFTPEPGVKGRLAGFFFHTVSNAGAGGTFNLTSLSVEIRSSNAGVPGTLLGTLTIPPANISKFSFNYFDLSSLSIPITVGTDFFIVLVPGAGSTWGVRRDNLVVDNRSLISTDNGSTWTNPAVDYRIRAVVYDNPQISGNIATINSTDTRNINTSNQFVNGSCQLIAQLFANGTSPVTGNVEGRVWLETGVPRSGGGDPFVSRHYQIAPTASTATGRVTLYFTQAEFTAFNNDAASALDLPANPTDAAGKANLRVSKYPGTSSNGTGLPNTYTGTPIIIDPADGDIVWNATANRWEVSFDVTGFSGFFIQTKPTILPIVIEYFTGKKEASTNVLDWKVSCGSSTATRFVIERSTDGAAFSTIGSLSATQARCTQAFTYTDRSPVSGANYYRIKITEVNGNVYYTNTVLLQSDRLLTNGLYPTYIVKGAAVQVSFAGASGNLVVNDAAGKQIYSHNLRTGVQSLSLPVQASGVYFYKLIENNKTVVASGKLVVQ